MHAPPTPVQHELLERAARLVDDGRLRTTMTTEPGPIDAAGVHEAPALVESLATIGKVVIVGW